MRSTFSRVFFPAALLLLIALMLVGTSFQMLVRNYLTNQAMESLENDGKAISSLASAYFSEGGLHGRDFYVNLSIASQVSDADAVIFDAKGRLLLCSDAPYGCKHQGWVIEQESYIRQVLDQGIAQHTGRFQGLYDDARYVVSVPILDARTNEGLGIVMVSTPMASTVRVLDQLSDIYLFVSVLSVIIAMVVMSIFARRHSAPLREMANAARAFGHGKLDARVQVSHSYAQEIEELALAFNNMASSLQKSEYQRQEFVANVSHELKTPMTTIGGYIDGILDGTIPPERSRHYMQIVSAETKRLSRLVRSMLDISQLQDQNIPEEKKTRFDLTECAGRTLLTFEQKILSKDLLVEVDMPEHPVYTLANEDYITQVIYNLLDNAVKFCPAGGQLGLVIREGPEKAYVSVSNQGETIPPEELPLVFDRFHKTDKSRSQNRDGWGLGLYIVKTIVCSHGENISVSSRDGKTEFTFTMPVVS